VTDPDQVQDAGRRPDDGVQPPHPLDGAHPLTRSANPHLPATSASPANN
jgi:hypothetical protein